MPFKIRPYTPADAAQIAVLFHETVRQVNLADYTREQEPVGRRRRCSFGHAKSWPRET